MPAAVTHRRRLRSIDDWHRAARRQVGGTWCFVPGRHLLVAFCDPRRAQPSSIEAGADPAASCKPLFSERVGEQPRSKLRHRGALRGAAGASSLLAGRRHSSAAASIDRSLDIGARSEEPPGRRRCLPAAVTHRRRLRSIDGWHRAARWQVAGTSRVPCRRGLDATPRSGRRGRRVGSRAVGGGKAQAAARGRSQLTSERRPGSRNDKAR